MSKQAADLLERFVEMYGETPISRAMTESDPKLWYDYYKYSGQHMILTDEGWEPGESLASYMEGLDERDEIRDIVYAEINWHKGDRRFPRIFPRKPAAPSPQEGREIDWNDDEAVVRAAWKNVYRNGHPGGWIYGDGLMTNALGRSWAEARCHESVQAFERQHRTPVREEE